MAKKYDRIATSMDDFMLTPLSGMWACLLDTQQHHFVRAINKTTPTTTASGGTSLDRSDKHRIIDADT